MSDATGSDAGLAPGLAGTGQQIGVALGAAVLAVLAAAWSDGPVAAGAPLPEALSAGHRAAFAGSAAAVAAAAVLTVTVLRPRRLVQ